LLIFISEFLTSGAWDGQVSDSLFDEGRAMLLAFVEDAARIRGVRVVTTWDQRLGQFPLPDVDVRVINSPQKEATMFRHLARKSDTVFVIVPETDNLLLERYDSVHKVNGQWAGAARLSIERCTDKLLTARTLVDAGVPTIPTIRLDLVPDDCQFPLVVKPRDGAGAVETCIVGTHDELRDLSLTQSAESYIAQPWIEGTAVSAFCVATGNQPHLFPVAGQQIETDHRMKYVGGHMPLDVDVQQLVEDGLHAIGAQVGHFGIDIIIPAHGQAPRIVEINPRLTTSYLGYRQITRDNMAERILFPERFGSSIELNGRSVQFDSRGITSPPTASTETLQ